MCDIWSGHDRICGCFFQHDFMRDNLWNRCNVWRIPVHYNTNTETNTIWNLDSSNNEKGNCFISDSLTLFFHFKLFFYSKAETIFNKKAVKECLLHKLNLPVAMMAFQLWFNCIISCILSHDLSNDRHVLEEDAKRSTILQERIASISFSKNLITAFQTESRITHTVLYTSRHSVLLCLIFLKPAIIRQLTMCAFSGLWLLAIFFLARVCVYVCVSVSLRTCSGFVFLFENSFDVHVYLFICVVCRPFQRLKLQ